MKQIQKAFLIILVLALSSCGPTVPIEPTFDVNAIQTSAAETVVAEFTQTARAVPPTSAATATQADPATPEATTPPTETATPTTNPFQVTATETLCDDSNFDPATVDVTYPDGTEVTPGQDFVKTWKIRNAGSCTWGTGYTAIYAYGEKMDGIAEPFTGAVAPGEEVEISVRFQAPAQTGQYSSTWRMANTSNTPFGEPFFVLIVVR